MIGQYLPQTNESATVVKSKNLFASKQGLAARISWALATGPLTCRRDLL